MASFTRLDEATPENSVEYVKAFAAESTPEKMADRMIKMLEGWVIACRGDSFLKDFLLSLKGINCCNLVDLYEHNIQSGSRAFRWVHLSRAALAYLLCLEMARMRRLLSVLCFMMLGRWCLLFVMGRLVIICLFFALKKVFQWQVCFGHIFQIRTTYGQYLDEICCEGLAHLCWKCSAELLTAKQDSQQMTWAEQRWRLGRVATFRGRGSWIDRLWIIMNTSLWIITSEHVKGIFELT